MSAAPLHSIRHMPRSDRSSGTTLGRALRAAAVALAVAAPAIGAPAALQAQAGQVVGVGGTSTLGDPRSWTTSAQGSGMIEVTGNNPRNGWGGYNTGSLEMSVTGAVGANGEYPDWAFWYQYASTGTAFGSLAQLTSLSFDWFRVGDAYSHAAPGAIDENNQQFPPIDWRYKTPVMRLILVENRNGVIDTSEVIWEGYYNQCTLGSNANCNQNYTPLDQWVMQSNMHLDNFWYDRISVNEGSSSACDTQMSFWQGGVQASNTSGLFGEGGCLFGAQVDVIGIAVGVGSQWPLPYHGFVDNVRMGFGSPNTFAALSEGGNEAVNANFDFVPSTAVPEPSTYALMAAGLLALGVAARRRRK